MPLVRRVSFISDYRSLLLFPTILSPEKGSEEPGIDMPIVYVVSLSLFLMPYASVDPLCFPRTLVALKGLLTSGLTCGHALRIAKEKKREKGNPSSMDP